MMDLVFGREKINRIFFVLMNNTLKGDDVRHIQVVSFPAQVFLTKSRILGAKWRGNCRKMRSEHRLLSLSIQCLIKFHLLFSCCLFSTPRLWAWLWLPKQCTSHVPGEQRVARTYRAFQDINYREVYIMHCHDFPAGFCSILWISHLLKTIPSDIVCSYNPDTETFCSAPTLQMWPSYTKAYGRSSQFLRILKLVDLLSHT